MCLHARATRGGERRRRFRWGAEFLIQDRRLLCRWRKFRPPCVLPACFSLLDWRARLSHQDAPAKAGSCNRWRRRFPVAPRKLHIRIGRAASHQRPCNASRATLNFARAMPAKHLSELYFLAACASIFSITNALDPPRSYTFPLATTLSPASGRSFAFCPLDGVVSAIGQ